MIHTFGTRSLKNRQVDQLVQTDMAQRQRGFGTRFYFFTFFKRRTSFRSF